MNPLIQLKTRSLRLLTALTFACLALVLALGGARLEAGSALAGNGARIETNIERTIVRFTATYDNLIGGRFKCVGFRISNSALTNDSEDCILTDLSSWPVGTYIGNPYFNVNGLFYTWTSDYDALTANHVRIIITDNGDGTGHADIEAYY
jgi:hypothetical protein